MLSLYFYKLMGKIEEHKGKTSLMIDDYMVEKVLHKIKEIRDIKNFNNIKILINADDKLLYDITLKRHELLKMAINFIRSYF